MCLHGKTSVFLYTGTIPCRVLWYFDGFFYGSQESISTLPPQSWTKALRSADEKTYDHVGILFHAFPWGAKTTMDLKTPKSLYSNELQQVENLNLTVYKYSKTKKVKVFFSTTGIPANVRIAFRQQHGTALKSTTSQILHHLEKISPPIKF